MICSDELGLQCCGDLTYSGLFARYADSLYGTFHAEQPARYSNNSDYAYDRDLMIVDLGDDVHPLRHMPYTESKILRPLMVQQNLLRNTKKVQPFDRFEVVAGRLGALCHDIGECQHADLGETVGDINYYAKTQKHEKREAAIRSFFYDTLYKDVPVSLVAAAEATITGEPESFLSRAFRATEHIGYFLTGVRAGRLAIELGPKITNDQDAERVACLGRLGVTVANDWFDKLPQHSAEFPYARIIRDREAMAVERINEELAA
jgi:hypothetical protein